MSKNSIKINEEIYNIKHWGQDYFAIDAEGFLNVHPMGTTNLRVRLQDIQAELLEKNIQLPCLIRFTEILQHRLHILQQNFHRQIVEQTYDGNYTAVYPIKVNQQRTVVKSFLQHSNHFGLEAGSKPELLAVLSLAKGKNFTIVCNGYKDREYIRLALLGKRLGLQIFIIIEKPAELNLIIEESQKLQIEPLLGIRVRLAAIAAGNWQNTGGEKSKFGLTARQLFNAIETLKNANILNSLQLLHTHMGSQISNIADIHRGLQECAHFYAELHHLNVPITSIDIGGGLGIDYEGSYSKNYCSINYSLTEYASVVIATIKEICDKNQLPHPNIITEAGRAMTAHHAVLLLPIIEIERIAINDLQAPKNNAPKPLLELWANHQQLKENLLIKQYHDICYHYQELKTLFNQGLLSLSERAKADSIYNACCLRILNNLKPSRTAHQTIIDDLNDKFADKIFCNFSLFQSLPDVWAISQIFPILPIKNLDKPLSQRGIIQDITCDSDGRIHQYVDGETLQNSLPTPKLEVGDCLAVFLVGAYQETLGDMHNLFGDTHVVTISLDEDNKFEITEIELGDKISELLTYVHYDIDTLLSCFQTLLDQSSLSNLEQKAFLELYKQCLNSYSYLT